MAKVYDFDNLSNRQIDSARKWDEKIVTAKFPNHRKDFIPLWIADMDFKAAPEIRIALVKMAENGAYGYTYATERWYQSVVGWYAKRHGINLKEEWLTLGYGTVPNMHILVQAFLEAGGTVLMNTPIYGPFAYAAEHNNRQAIKIPLLKSGSVYALDLAKIEQAFKENRPKMLFFCNPHNPSGRIWQMSEITQVAALCQKYEVLLVSDEVHSEHIISGTFHSALELDAEYLQNLVVLTSPNKAFNLGGLKLSYSIIPNEKIRATLKEQYLKNSVTSPNVPGQIAMITAYESCLEWLVQCEDYIRINLQITEAYLNQYFDGWELMDMASSYLPWIDISNSGKSMHEIATRMADDAGVIVGVGDDYVANAEGFLRLNLGTSHAVVTEAMERMRKTWAVMAKE